MIVSDSRCIEHADFANKNNLREKISQRERQPENSDRLSLLIDRQTGVLSAGNEFNKKLKSTLVMKDYVEEVAKIADILKVHDFNYI